MSLKISRILHAGYTFECENTLIAFDPIFENPFSRNCYAYPAVKFDRELIGKLNLSAVFISHYHDDHCSLESLDFLDRKTPIYIYCIFEEMAEMIRELGFTNVQPLTIDTLVKVGSFEVIPRRALDADVDSIFHIKANGLNILNVVDSWIDDETLDLLAKTKSWDMILWPFQTMREIEVIAPSRASPPPNELPREWIQQLKILKPKYIVPSSCQFLQESWSWYNHAFFPITYLQFQREIEIALPETKVLRLDPSVSVYLNKDSIEFVDPLKWVIPLVDNVVDYEYKKDLTPPRTAEIAEKFRALTVEQSNRVYEFCTGDILTKYNSMDPPEDEYFKKPRNWKLSVYDHQRSSKNFYYKIEHGNMIRMESLEKPIAWSTEVPIAKFYAALDLGESLTSMYLRINDMTFEPAIETEIQSAEIVEDPLIRCLFTGHFGAYQRAQLKRLKK